MFGNDFIQRQILKWHNVPTIENKSTVVKQRVIFIASLISEPSWYPNIVAIELTSALIKWVL